MPIVITSPSSSPSPGGHYASTALIKSIYGLELYSYVFNLDGNGIDPNVEEWALTRGDEQVDARLGRSIYTVPLVSSDGKTLRFVPNWAAVYAFSAAYNIRGRQVDNEAAEDKYAGERRRVNHEIRLARIGSMKLNAQVKVGATATPIAAPVRKTV